MIDSFTGEYHFLSNFYPAPFKTSLFPEWTCPTVEHAYQAAKATDKNSQIYILGSPTPGTAKRRGRLVSIREDWDVVKATIMCQLVNEKFHQHPDLRQALLDTGDAELIEGNTWGDTYWGVCRGVGQNVLGHLLMQVRSQWRELEDAKTVS